MGELFLTVLNMSLTASYVILFVIVIRLLLKKAPKFISCALWGVVAFRLIIPFSFESMFSLLPRSTNTVPIPHDIIWRQSPRINSGIKAVDYFVNNSLPAPDIGTSVNPLKIYTEAGACIWAIGIVAMLAYSLLSVLLLKRQLKCAKLIEQNIYEAENLKTPFVLGLLRPKVYLPVGLNIEERSYILLHEQTHIHRKDHIIKVLAFLTLSIHWFNPFVWIAFMLLSADMELSCDERVLKEMNEDIKKSYAYSLLSLATGKHILNGSPLAFGEGNVKGRIKNVLDYKKPRFWAAVLSIVIVTAAGIGLMANPDVKDSSRVSDNGPVRHIQVEITKTGSRILTGIVVTDKDGYKAGDIVTVSIGEKVSYDVASLVAGDWVDIAYRTVRGKAPPEFAADHLNRITGIQYPTAFVLIENGHIVKSNTLRNPRVASEMPALILSGSADSSLRIDGVPDNPRYLKIDIGSLGDKIYYTFEKDGKCYAGHDNMHEITRQTFDELMQYVYKNEITDKRVTGKTTLEPAAPELSPGQTVGADMVELDFASDDIVIFHDYFGLFVYDLNSLQIIRSLDLKPLNCHQTQGDNYCDVSVSTDGNTVQLHPMSSENMFVYTLSDNTLQETAYKPMDNPFRSQFVSIEEVIDSTKIGNHSHHAILFDTREYGYIYTEDGRIGTLSYVRGDMVYRLFDFDSSFEEWEFISLADINRDNREESIYIDKSQTRDGLVTLRIIGVSGAELWSEQLSTSHAGWGQLFLCELDGRQYLLRYNPTMYQGYCSYVYTLFTLEGGKEKVIRTNNLEFDINGTKELDVPKMIAFADEVNVLLSRSSLLISSNGGDFSFSPLSVELFFERFSWLDEYKKLFEDGDSLKSKLEKFSEYAVSNHISDGQPKAMPD